MSSLDGRGDDDLTVALAEYAYLAEARKTINEQSNARFNFFLVVTTAVAAVSAGVLTGGPGNAEKTGTIGTLGVLTLVLGISIYLRLIEFSRRGHRYAAAQDALRTYLGERAPNARKYLLLPTLGDPGVVVVKVGYRRDAVSLAGTVGLLNSMLLALGVGLTLGIWLDVTGFVPAAICAVIFVIAFAAHVTYLRSRMRLSRREIDTQLRERGLI